MIKTNDKSKNALILILTLTCLGMGVSLMLKAQIGLAAWDALSATLSQIFRIKVGYASMISNFALFILQIIILAKAFNKSQYLQIPVMLFFGLVINFFLYRVFTFPLTAYWQRIVVFVVGTAIVAFCAALLVKKDLVTMPTEGFSKAVSMKSKLTFSQVRLGLDIITIAFCLIAVPLFKIKLEIREGTLICTVIFNYLISLFLQILSKGEQKS